MEQNKENSNLIKRQIRAAIKSGANPNELTPSQKSPLYLAAMSGNLAAVKELLKQGSHINVGYINPLVEATVRTFRTEQPSFAQSILFWDPKNVRNNTPLHASIFHGKIDVFLALLAHKGIDLNLQNENGSTPLQYAIHFQKTEFAENLLKYDLDLKTCTVDRTTVLHTAASMGNLRILNALLKSSAFQKMTKSEKQELLNQQEEKTLDTALHMLCRMQGPNIAPLVGIFLDLGADPHLANAKAQTPLHLAAQGQSIFSWPIIAELLKHGANPNAKDHLGNIPLFYSAKNLDEEQAKTWKKAGANPFQVNEDGESALRQMGSKNWHLWRNCCRNDCEQ